MKGKAAAVLFIGLMLTLPVFAVFARESAPGEVQKGNPTVEFQGQAQAQKGHGGEIAAIVSEIREDRSELIGLRQETVRLMQQLQQRLRAMCEENLPVDKQLASRIQEHLRNVREQRLALAQTLGTMRGFSMQMRVCRSAGDLDEVVPVLEGVRAVQQERIRNLNQIRRQLEQLLELLE